jgi:MFS family permease
MPVRNRWVIVVACGIALIVGQGAINVFAAGVFMNPVAQELGFGRGTISTAIGSSSILTALATPFFGRLIDTRGVRPILLTSIVLFAASVAAMSLLQPSTTLLFALFAASGLVSVGQNPTAYSKVICAWFDRERGLALGIALAGVGLGTALMPQLSTFLISHLGWREGYLGLAGAIIVLAFIPVALLVWEPARAPGAGYGAHPPAVGAPLVGVTLAQARRDWRYWALVVVFFCGATPVTGTLIHIVPLLTDRGIPVTTAVAALSGSGLALIGGRVLAGWVMDRVFAPYVAIFFLALPMAGIAILGLGLGGAGPIAGTVLLGLGIGAEIDLMSFLIARYFGIKEFGSLHGLMFCSVLLGNFAGASLLGWSYQGLGSYGPGFIVFEIMLALACLLLLRLGPYRYPVDGVGAAVGAGPWPQSNIDLFERWVSDDCPP